MSCMTCWLIRNHCRSWGARHVIAYSRYFAKLHLSKILRRCIGRLIVWHAISLHRYNQRMIPILMYHQVGQPGSKGAPYRGLTVHPADFRRQMTWLRRLGYRGLSMRDLMPYLRGEQQGKVVGITFDDGYRNVARSAFNDLC